MARLGTTGAESRLLTTTVARSGENGFYATGTVGIDTLNERSGEACFSMGTGGANYLTTAVAPAVQSRHYYARAYVRISANPSVAVRLMAYYTSTTVLGYAQLETNGTVTLRNAAGTQIGSATGALTAGTYYRLELHIAVGTTTGNGTLELAIDGTIGDRTSTATNAGTAVATPTFRVGQVVSVASTITVYIDDVAVNDDQGADQADYPGAGVVDHLWPVGETINGGWQAPQTTGSDVTNIYTAVANRPPIGVAHSDVDANNQKYIFDAVSETAAYDATVESYEEAGIAAGSTIKLTQACFRLAGSSATGTNNASGQCLSNPADGGDTTFTAAFDNVGDTDGTSTVGWTTWESPLTYHPTVDTATRPVIRINKITAATRAHMVDQMFLLVEYADSQTETLTAVSETDAESALALETDVDLTPDVETDTAQRLSYIEKYAVSASSEADSAQALDVETDAGINVASEQDVAGTVSREALDQYLGLDTVAEADSADGVYRSVGLSLIQPYSVAAAAIQFVTIGTVAEADSAAALSHTTAATVAAVSEADATSTLAVETDVSLAAASETDTAGALSIAKEGALSAKGETDTAAALSSEADVSLATGAETDVAQALTATKTGTLTADSEADTAAALAAAKTVTLIAVAETDTAGALTSQAEVTLGAASEQDVAGILTVPGVQRPTLTIVTEADATQALVVETDVSITADSETDTANALAVETDAGIAAKAETDTANALTFTQVHGRTITTAVETDVAVTVTWSEFGQGPTEENHPATGGAVDQTQTGGAYVSYVRGGEVYPSRRGGYVLGGARGGKIASSTSAGAQLTEPGLVTPFVTGDGSASGGLSSNATGGAYDITRTGGRHNENAASGHVLGGPRGGAVDATIVGGAYDSVLTGGDYDRTKTGAEMPPSPQGGDYETVPTGGDYDVVLTGGAYDTTVTGGNVDESNTGGDVL